MELKNLNIGFAITGSFCTFKRVFPQIEELSRQGARIIPIMSEISYTTDTRFGKAEEHINFLESVTGEKVIGKIKEAEPIGPKKLLDLLIVAPCTGNTISKLASGITDTSVTMAAKAHLRNERPLLIAPSTNDGLGANAKNLGLLLNTKNVYFVPFGQDDPFNKHNSLVADFTKIIPSIEAALNSYQLQPILT